MGAEIAPETVISPLLISLNELALAAFTITVPVLSKLTMPLLLIDNALASVLMAVLELPIEPAPAANVNVPALITLPLASVRLPVPPRVMPKASPVVPTLLFKAIEPLLPCVESDTAPVTVPPMVMLPLAVMANVPEPEALMAPVVVTPPPAVMASEPDVLIEPLVPTVSTGKV